MMATQKTIKLLDDIMKCRFLFISDLHNYEDILSVKKANIIGSQVYPSTHLPSVKISTCEKIPTDIREIRNILYEGTEVLIYNDKYYILIYVPRPYSDTEIEITPDNCDGYDCIKLFLHK
jgi:hypothetical protein